MFNCIIQPQIAIVVVSVVINLFNSPKKFIFKNHCGANSVYTFDLTGKFLRPIKLGVLKNILNGNKF